MLQMAQQATTAKLKDEVAKIGIRIQEQSGRTLLQEQTRKEQQDRTMDQLSQQMKAEVHSTRQQAVNATQLAVQVQSVMQFASTIISAYETKMGKIQHNVNQLQQLVINKRQNRMKWRVSYLQHKIRLVLQKDVLNC